MTLGRDESGIQNGVTFATSTVGNAVGGVARTVGGIVGAGGRGVGETIANTTGKPGRPGGEGVADGTTGIESGTKRVAEGVEAAGRAPGR